MAGEKSIFNLDLPSPSAIIESLPTNTKVPTRIYSLMLISIFQSPDQLNQKMVSPFIRPLKSLGYHPEHALINARYDSEANYFVLREELGCISFSCTNRQRAKKRYSRKLSENYQKF
ncbi:MAG: hypothetical protein ACTSRL_03740 [Candidatus Helarchaeota archaeon]